MAEKYWQVIDTADTKSNIEGKVQMSYNSSKNLFSLSLCKMQVADGSSSVKCSCKGMKNL